METDRNPFGGNAVSIFILLTILVYYSRLKKKSIKIDQHRIAEQMEV